MSTEFMINMFVKQINDANGPMYLPKLILASTTPSLDPLRLKDVNLGDVDLDIPGIGDVEAKFTSLDVVGLANVLIPADAVTVSGNAVTATAHISKLDPAPAGVADTVTVVGNIEAVNEDGKGISGKLTITIEEAEVDVAGNVSLDGDPTINLEKIEFRADTSSSNINSTIKLDGSRLLSGIVDKFFDMPQVRDMLIKSINSEIAGDLEKLSAASTQALRLAL